MIKKGISYVVESKLKTVQGFDEVEDVIRTTISEIAREYPDDINNHIFIRRLSNGFNS